MNKSSSNIQMHVMSSIVIIPFACKGACLLVRVMEGLRSEVAGDGGDEVRVTAM